MSNNNPSSSNRSNPPSQPHSSDNGGLLQLLPLEIRKWIDGYTPDAAARQLAQTSHSEHGRREDKPPRDRYCYSEIKQIGAPEPLHLSPGAAMLATPSLRNIPYQQQYALVKAILLQALEMNRLNISINATNFQHLLTLAREPLECVLKYIQNIYLTIIIPNTIPPQYMDMNVVAWIIRNINNRRLNGQRARLFFLGTPPPYSYFIYTLESEYGQALQLPAECNIDMIDNGNVPQILRQWGPGCLITS